MLIISLRGTANISAGNKYLFAKFDKYIEGTAVMSDFAKNKNKKKQKKWSKNAPLPAGGWSARSTIARPPVGNCSFTTITKEQFVVCDPGGFLSDTCKRACAESWIDRLLRCHKIRSSTIGSSSSALCKPFFRRRLAYGKIVGQMISFHKALKDIHGVLIYGEKAFECVVSRGGAFRAPDDPLRTVQRDLLRQMAKLYPDISN